MELFTMIASSIAMTDPVRDRLRLHLLTAYADSDRQTVTDVLDVMHVMAHTHRVRAVFKNWVCVLLLLALLVWVMNHAL